MMPTHTAAALVQDGERRITLALAGDVMLGRLVDEVIRSKGPRYIWGNVRSLLRDADLTLVNLECAIARGGKPFEPPRVFSFRADPAGVEALKQAGIDVVSQANNHAMDYRAEGLLETIAHLDGAGILHVGAGATLAAAATPAMVEVGGVRIAVLAFADHPREYAATVSQAGTNVLSVTPMVPGLERLRTGVEAARAAGANVVIVSAHWGPNMRVQPTEAFVQFAHAAMELGVDIFHGHSAHVFQGIEVYAGNKLILYDTGDLIDDYRVDPVLRNDQQLLFLVTVGGAGLERVELVPLRIDRMRVNLARGRDADEIAERITRLSRRFHTTIERQRNRLVVRLDDGTSAVHGSTRSQD